MSGTQVRYAGFAIAYNVSTAAFGGTAPLVNDWVIKVTDWDLFPAAYLMGACVFGLVAVYFLTETAGVSIRGTEIPSKENDFSELAGMKADSEGQSGSDKPSGSDGRAPR